VAIQYWLEFDPQSGREQAGTRPAPLVLSSARYNGRARLALVCPVTSRIKGYPFEQALPQGLPIQGVVLSDQVRSLDWNTRRARTTAHLDEVLASVGVGSEVRKALVRGADKTTKEPDSFNLFALRGCKRSAPSGERASCPQPLGRGHPGHREGETPALPGGAERLLRL
jgi:mRNA interferase MazF